jgi:hypothetical protein
MKILVLNSGSTSQKSSLYEILGTLPVLPDVGVNFIRFLAYSAAEAQSCKPAPTKRWHVQCCTVRHGEPHYAHAVSTKFEARGPISVIGYLPSSSNPMLMHMKFKRRKQRLGRLAYVQASRGK